MSDTKETMECHLLITTEFHDSRPQTQRESMEDNPKYKGKTPILIWDLKGGGIWWYCSTYRDDRNNLRDVFPVLLGGRGGLATLDDVKNSFGKTDQNLQIKLLFQESYYIPCKIEALYKQEKQAFPGMTVVEASPEFIKGMHNYWAYLFFKTHYKNGLKLDQVSELVSVNLQMAELLKQKNLTEYRPHRVETQPPASKPASEKDRGFNPLTQYSASTETSSATAFTVAVAAKTTPAKRPQ